ncbi:MAG TPA: FlgD immunoglobulin-like domain containing protein [Candidatus Krumholzibacteria bacterium]|nr:FlgD immunoglobulin-like domain containing protein [Candidatus Krumholzibacteria bacterium]
MQRIGHASGSVCVRSFGLARAATVVVLSWAALGHPRPACAVDATVLMYGVKPATSFDLIRNGVPVSAGASTALGSLAFVMDVSTGTLVAIAPVGDLAPPAPPLFTSVEVGLPGCATASWMQSGDPTVIGYVVAYGSQSVAGGGASNYENMIEVGATGSAEVCFLPLGRQYFAVRAKNIGGMLSAYSVERSVDIVIVSVLISRFDARPRGDGVHLEWQVEADEVVSGYRVYRGAAGEAQRVLNDALLPSDATSFVDASVRGGVAYTYVLAAVKENGEEVFSIPVVAMVAPLSFDLEPNVPNPFNPTTRIGFTLPESARAILRIYDVRGSHVATVLDSPLGAGRHHVEWNGVDDAGTPVASGTYFYTLAAGKRTVARKMVLVK